MVCSKSSSGDLLWLVTPNLMQSQWCRFSRELVGYPGQVELWRMHTLGMVRKWSVCTMTVKYREGEAERDVLAISHWSTPCIFCSSSRVMNAHRTCSIWLGVGNGEQKDFRIFQYSASTAKVWAAIFFALSYQGWPWCESEAWNRNHILKHRVHRENLIISLQAVICSR